MTKIRIGSRKSKLAMWQTYYVQDRLNKDGIDTEVFTMETKGDKILDTSIAKIGSKGVFTEELEDQLANGDIDIAVHSAKDMPSLLPDGFELIAFTNREKSEDVLVSHNPNLRIEDQSKKIIIGTSSVRRRALLRLYYPHVETVDIRGNLQTRIKKMKDGLCDGIMLAYAGVHRMNLESMIVQSFPKNTFVPPVGQGCIAIEAASTLPIEKRDSIRVCLNNPDSEACLLAERAFLRRLEGGCSIPAFGLATLDGDTISLSAGLVSLDGQKNISSNRSGSRSDAEAIGEEMGDYILNSGGRELLAEIRSQQD
ncbi:MAG: hydroxymethylbilane synthase [Thermodesulfobacteriota bacterium]|nr:hydroxymethylbilane synthase [Thermodesulfobacteriota bacterium]